MDLYVKRDLGIQEESETYETKRKHERDLGDEKRPTYMKQNGPSCEKRPRYTRGERNV